MAGSGAEARSWSEGRLGRGNRGRRGATLAELLVALTLLSIGMAATAGILSLASGGIAHAEVAFRGALVASEALGGTPVTPGAREVEWGVFRWSPAASGGVEVRFEPAAAGSRERRWVLEPGAPEPEEPPWWRSW